MGRVSMPQGKGSQMHNRRDYDKYGKNIPDNIDSSKTWENVVLVDKDIKAAYQEIFGEALEKYNGKQKRADRKIEDYCDHIKKSKNGEKLFYEDVVQWGSKDDFESPETRVRAKEALVKYVEGFEKRNPNLKLIGAYIHMDEASPHLHLDYVPVATGYSRGLEKRNSLDKAMKQMGFQPEQESRKNNATKLWKEKERAYFGHICRNMGLEVEPERKARGSLSVDEYKEARDELMSELDAELKNKQKRIESQNKTILYKQGQISQLNNKIANITVSDELHKALTEMQETLEDAVNDYNNLNNLDQSLEQNGKSELKLNSVIEKWDCGIAPVNYYSSRATVRYAFNNLIDFLLKVINDLKDFFSELLGYSYQKEIDNVSREVEQQDLVNDDYDIEI